MSMIGEIESTKHSIRRLQLALADPRVPIEKRLSMVNELSWELERLEKLQEPRLKIHE